MIFFKYKKTISPLEEWSWDFYYNDGVLWLDNFAKWKKESTRHKFKRVENSWYSRLKHRESEIKADQVPLDDEVKKEIMAEYVKNLTVQLWPEKKY